VHGFSITNNTTRGRGCGLEASGSDEGVDYYHDIATLATVGVATGAHSISSRPSLSSDGHLRRYSRCIDEGTPVAGITTDFEGQPRPTGKQVDIVSQLALAFAGTHCEDSWDSGYRGGALTP